MSDPTKNTRIQRKNPITIMGDMGKLQPQSVDTEEVVLGALMLEREAYSVIAGLLHSDCFYKDEHKEIFTAMTSLFTRNEPIDLLTVTNELRKTGKLEFSGGAFYISELTNRVASAANIEHHALIIMQKYMSRQLISMTSEIQRDAYDETIEVWDTVGSAQTMLASIIDIKSANRIQKLFDIIFKIYKSVIESNNNPQEEDHGFLTGYKKLDEALGGLQAGDICVIAARPGMGKTSLITSVAKKSAKNQKKKVGIMSLEMTADQLAIKIICEEAKISARTIRNKTATNDQMEFVLAACLHMEEWGIYIDDEVKTLLDLTASATKMKKLGVEVIIIDYLQLLQLNSGSSSKSTMREQEISAISRAIKQLAKKLGIPIILLSQLSRATEQRGGQKRPILSDLRESGAIEQDADQVIFIHRPEYYGVTEDANHNALPPGLTELILAKNRHGPTDVIVVKFIDYLATFVDEDLDEHLIRAIEPTPYQKRLPYKDDEEDMPF